MILSVNNDDEDGIYLLLIVISSSTIDVAVTNLQLNDKKFISNQWCLLDERLKDGDLYLWKDDIVSFQYKKRPWPWLSTET